MLTSQRPTRPAADSPGRRKDSKRLQLPSRSTNCYDRNSLDCIGVRCGGGVRIIRKPAEY